jgi:hypothetical protein
MPEESNGKHDQEEVKELGMVDEKKDHGKDMVTIYVNDSAVLIHRGNQTVAANKVAGNVPSADILYLMPNYEVALSDSDTITIKGGERFKFSAPSGGSS